MVGSGQVYLFAVGGSVTDVAPRNAERGCEGGDGSFAPAALAGGAPLLVLSGTKVPDARCMPAVVAAVGLAVRRSEALWGDVG